MKYVLLIEVSGVKAPPNAAFAVSVDHVTFDTESEAEEAFSILKSDKFPSSFVNRRVTRLYNPTYP